MDLEIIKPKIGPLAAKYKLNFVVLFGSRAAGKNVREDSDFDIALYRERPERLASAELEYYSNLLFGFTKIFGVFEDKIDLTDLRQADPLLRYEITRGGALLFGDELEYEEFKLFAQRDYMDTQDLRNLEEAIINKKQLLLSR